MYTIKNIYIYNIIYIIYIVHIYIYIILTDTIKSTKFFGTQSFMPLAQQSSAERTRTVKFATI